MNHWQIYITSINLTSKIIVDVMIQAKNIFHASRIFNSIYGKNNVGIVREFYFSTKHENIHAEK